MLFVGRVLQRLAHLLLLDSLFRLPSHLCIALKRHRRALAGVSQSTGTGRSLPTLTNIIAFRTRVVFLQML